MRPDDRDDAEALALAIEHSLVDAHQAVEWGRELMSHEKTSSDELLELAGAIRPHPLDVVGMLRRLPGVANPVRVFRLVLGRAHKFVLARPNAWSHVTYALEQIALQADIPDRLAEPCLRFDDQRLLAERGTYGNLAQIQAELIAFLEAEAEP